MIFVLDKCSVVIHHLLMVELCLVKSGLFLEVASISNDKKKILIEFAKR